MGTRALTVFKDDNKEIAVLYREYDGYPDEHGKQLSAFLKGKRIVNGFGNGTIGENGFNGMGCLAARVIGHFKGNQIGGFYLYPAGTRDCGEEWIYVVREADGKPAVTVEDVYNRTTYPSIRAAIDALNGKA